MAKKSPSQKALPKRAAPNPKPMNGSVKNAFNLLGGLAAAKTPLTRQHGEKMIAAHHGLPPHAAQNQKQAMYDVEAKAFDEMQKPNATLGDFFKSIGAMPEVEQKQDMRSTNQQARINAAKQARMQEQQVEKGIVAAIHYRQFHNHPLHKRLYPLHNQLVRLLTSVKQLKLWQLKNACLCPCSLSCYNYERIMGVFQLGLEEIEIKLFPSP